MDTAVIPVLQSLNKQFYKKVSINLKSHLLLSVSESENVYVKKEEILL